MQTALDVDECRGGEALGDDVRQQQQQPPPPPPGEGGPLVSDELASIFQNHVVSLKRRRDERKAQLTLRGVAQSVDGDADGKNNATSNEINSILASDDDTFEGDGVLRTLQALLSRIDERGYARSTQQMRFHDAFIRACSRVLYRNDWSTNRPAIMKKNAWDSSPSEILISTPRRFGKTFSCERARPAPPRATPGMSTRVRRPGAQNRHLRGSHCNVAGSGNRHFLAGAPRVAQAARKNHRIRALARLR